MRNIIAILAILFAYFAANITINKYVYDKRSKGVEADSIKRSTKVDDFVNHSEIKP